MCGVGRTLLVSCIASLATGCASFEVIHDPRFGAVSKEHLPKLIKSVKCELETFYSINRIIRQTLDNRRRQLAREGRKTIELKKVLELKHFDLDEEAYGSFSLDIKVQDQFGIPGTSTSLANVLSSSTGHSMTATLGPSVQAQATYDNVLWFSIGQNSEIKLKNGELTEEQLRSVAFLPDPEKEEHLCFRGTVTGQYLELEDGGFPQLELFDRIRVNGQHTLAAWLQENSQTMGISRNILVDAHAMAEKRPRIPVETAYTSQAIDGGQLAYAFTVQYTGALDAKFSLVSPRWNPIAADLSASVQQTGVLSIYVNGYQAAAAIGAKSALTAIVAAPPKPTKVIIIEDDTRKNGLISPAAQEKIKGIVTPPAAQKSESGSPISTDAVSDFMTELAKDQLLPGQAQATKEALARLNLRDDVRARAETAIRDSSTLPPRQKVITIPSDAPATTQQNDGRGVFRYPPAFPSQ